MYEVSSSNASTAGSVAGSIVTIIVCAYLLFTVWRIFAKAGERGWKAIIPFVNLWTEYKIIWGKGAYMFFLLIPVYDIIFEIRSSIRLAHAFGKSTGFGIGLFFLAPIFYSILAFDKSTYQGPQA